MDQGVMNVRGLARVVTVVLATVLVLYFLLPQLAMARFAFQAVPTALLSWDSALRNWSADALITALQKPALWTAVRTSIVVAILTTLLNLTLLVPVALVADIRARRLKPWITAVTLLPWVIPPIALVVGVAATFRTLLPWFLASPLSLVPFYALWSMPFTYRALDAGLRAVNARTLYEAGRSLGASAPTILRRVLVPNLGTAVLASAGLTVATVLGEFAFASLLLKDTLPTYLASYQRSDPRGGMALALVVMLLTAAGLWLVVHLLRRRGIDVSTTGL